MKDTFSSLIVKFADTIVAASEPFSDADSFQEVLNDWGWYPASYSNEFFNIYQLSINLKSALQNIKSDSTSSELLNLLDTANDLYKAVKGIKTVLAGIADPDFLQGIEKQFVSLFAEKLFSTESTNFLSVLTALDLVAVEVQLASDVRESHIQTKIDFLALQKFLVDPLNYLKDIFLDENNLLDIGAILNLVSEVAHALNLSPSVLNAQQLGVLNYGTALSNDTAQSALTFSLLPSTQNNVNLLGVSILPFLESILIPDIIPNSEIELETVNLNGGISLRLTSISTPVIQSLSEDTTLTMYPLPGGNLLDIIISQNYVKLALAADGTDTGTIINNPLLEVVYAPKQPLTLIGRADTTNLKTEGIALSFGLLKNTKNQQDFALTLTFLNSLLSLVGSEGDSFLTKILPENCSVPIPLSVNITSDGIRFNTSANFTAKIAKSIKIGSLEILNLSVSLQTKNETIAVAATTDIKVVLGPVELSVQDIGAVLQMRNLVQEDKLFSIHTSFQMPEGVGVMISSDTIKGGGHLSINPEAHRYTGVANLTFRDKLTLNAVGILQTELPDGRDGYSLLLLVTAQFSPLQLGLGFTLNGVGGLVGVNRTVDIPYLRSQVRTGGFADLLFPANVLDNPGTALAAIDRAFPAAEGRYVFGLMAQIGWGSVKTGNATYSLLTLDAALLIELPALRLALLGVLRLLLPNPERAVLRLRADFLGTVDFAAKKIAFDASLVDSSLLQFALTGDMAFRLYHGENPVFLLTTGGFHPAFQPPANAELPTIRRLPLALANSRDLRLILTSYVALTSNTVQFGSRLDLFMDLPAGFSLEGFMGFDVLFQVQPFRLQAYVGASVAIKQKNSTKLSIYLALNVSGPAPWHVVGEASFKVLGFKLKARIDRTFGKGAIAEPERAINVRRLFLDALKEASNWEMEPPTGSTRNATVLRATPQDPSYLLIDPSGSLVFRQQLVPLQYSLQKFSNAKVTGGNQFDLTGIEPLLPPSSGGTLPTTRLEAVTDFFAPEQFRRMSDAQKLSEVVQLCWTV